MEWIKKIGSCLASGLRFIQNHFKATLCLCLFVIWLILPASEEGLTSYNLQKISLVGPHLDATSIVEQFDEARKNKNREGLFSIDSPGGAVS